MKKQTKFIIFLVAAATNTIFFVAFDYGKVRHPETASYLDPFLGVLAVLVLALGEMKIVPQLYCRVKYKNLKKQFFDLKFWRQVLAIATYYVGSLVYLSAATTAYKASYLSVFALALSPLWLSGGSRILWTGEKDEKSYYMDETTKLYVVSNVMENEDVVEITCQASGDRERTISIAKKNQKLDQ